MTAPRVHARQSGEALPRYRRPYGKSASPAVAVAPLLALVIAVGALAGCGGGNTACGTDGCTVTFARSGRTEVSVLGVPARLVRVDADIAQVEVAGQTVQVPVGAQTEIANGLLVGVEKITDTEVVVRITRA